MVQLKGFISMLAASVLVGNVLASEEVQIVVQAISEDKCVAAQDGDLISIHYIGTLADGTEFDNSFKRGDPITFTLGAGQVIKGWDQGLNGICIGERRRLTIPPELGYGSRGVGPIPGGATLVFDAALVKIEGKDHLFKDEL